MKLLLVLRLVAAPALVLSLTACTERANMNPSTPESAVSSREAAETATSVLQLRLIREFPSTAINETPDLNWTRLACSDSEVQSATGADLTIPHEVSPGKTFAAIARAVAPDGYTVEHATNDDGDPELVVTGAGGDQYFITIINEKRTVVISSFSQCFSGTLTDD